MKCLCNCNQETKPGRRYIHGHNVAHAKLVLSDMPTQRDPKTGCLLFLGQINKVSGYGYLGQRPAHRVAYEEAYGSIPHGLTIDHVYARGCLHRNCIEPGHLEAVSAGENARRAIALVAKATHCRKGHPLSGVNLKVTRHRGRIERVCITCDRRRKRDWYARHKNTSLPKVLG